MRSVAIAVALTLLAGCGGQSNVQVYEIVRSPDDAFVVPVRPLVIPPVLSLPQPTPGAGNRADPDPEFVAATRAALGG